MEGLSQAPSSCCRVRTLIKDIPIYTAFLHPQPLASLHADTSWQKFPYTPTSSTTITTRTSPLLDPCRVPLSYNVAVYAGVRGIERIVVDFIQITATTGMIMFCYLSLAVSKVRRVPFSLFLSRQYLPPAQTQRFK